MSLLLLALLVVLAVWTLNNLLEPPLPDIVAPPSIVKTPAP